MSLSHLYDDFGGVASALNGTLSSAGDAEEEARLEAFEDGYKAGWDDAIKAHEKDCERVAAELLQHLQDMAFTHTEVEHKLLSGLAPILTQITGTLLPRMAMETFGAQVATQIQDLTKQSAATAVELAISPEAMPVLRAQVTDKVPLPFTLVEDDNLSSGMAYLRAGNEEVEVNVDAVVKGVTDAMAAFLDQSLKEPMDD